MKLVGRQRISPSLAPAYGPSSFSSNFSSTVPQFQAPFSKYEKHKENEKEKFSLLLPRGGLQWWKEERKKKKKRRKKKK